MVPGVRSGASGDGVGVWCATTGEIKHRGDGAVLYLDCCGDYMNPHVIQVHRTTHTHKQMSTCKASQISLRSMLTVLVMKQVPLTGC